MTMQNITLTAAGMTLFATLLWLAKVALTPKKQKIALKVNQKRR